jgi:hypothetical protein
MVKLEPGGANFGRGMLIADKDNPGTIVMAIDCASEST